MELQTRHRRVPTWRKIALNGLGADPGVNVTTMWTPSGGWAGSSGPAVYQAPTLIPTPACISGPQPYSAECQAQLMAAQQTNLAASSSANRAVDEANCNRDWEMNAARFRELGMAVPPNDCAYRGYGLTLPGTTGGYSGYLQGTPQEIIDWRNLNPGGGSPGPQAQVIVSAGGTQFAFTNLTSGDNTNFRVGDRWQIQILAAPNLPVTMSGGRNGENVSHSMGSTDATGRFILNGQMGEGEIGDWREAWRVAGNIIKDIGFKVSPSGGSVAAAQATGGGQSTQTQPPNQTSVFGTLPGGSISIGGTDIPWVLIGGGLAVAYFLFMRGK